MADISTRRAIEVCMSRLRLCRSTQDDLARLLSATITNPPQPPSGDADELRAHLLAVLELASGVEGYPRRSLLARMDLIRETVRRATEAAE